VVVRVLYPGLWLDARRLRQTAASELGHEEGRVGVLQFLAVLIPLAGAALMVSSGPGEFLGHSYTTFRYLVTALLAAGMLGLGLALVAGNELRQAVGVLVPPARPRR
jgi:hypothetical protein